MSAKPDWIPQFKVSFTIVQEDSDGSYQVDVEGPTGWATEVLEDWQHVVSWTSDVLAGEVGVGLGRIDRQSDPDSIGLLVEGGPLDGSGELRPEGPQDHATDGIDEVPGGWERTEPEGYDIIALRKPDSFRPGWYSYAWIDKTIIVCTHFAQGRHTADCCAVPRDVAAWLERETRRLETTQ